MPKVPPEYLDCFVSIYESKESAASGENNGGSGFLIAVPLTKHRDWFDLYAVTNAHCVREGNRFIRLNTHDGGTEILETHSSDWKRHPNGDDVAIFRIESPKTIWKFKFVKAEACISQSDMTVEPGDDVFIIGRFMGHEKKITNVPSVRFGNISMMPVEPITMEHTGIKQEAFLVECRSMPGYSGSPVFVYHLTGSVDRFTQVANFVHYPRLLGIDCCHFKGNESVLDEHGYEIPDKWYVKTQSGMTGVVPAWKLVDLLNDPELVKMRDDADAQITREVAQSSITLD